MLLDAVRRCGSIETNSVNEIEELVDTGLEKTEENIHKAAMEYLEEKGYAFREDNLVRAKQYILDSSEGSDTIRVRKKHSFEEDLLADIEDEEVEKLSKVSILDKLVGINEKLDRLTHPRYQYAVEVVDDILTEKDRPQASLQQFESFQSLLNRYAEAGWRVVNITARETVNHKISMTGFSSVKKEIVIVFEHVS